MDNCKLEGMITVKGTVSGSLASHTEKAPPEPKTGWIPASKNLTSKKAYYVSTIIANLRKEN